MLIAQSDSLEVHTINGKNYYIHVVGKGESLYAIGKKYNVPLDVIKKENPSVNDGLSIGEKVFIPIKRDEVLTNQIDGNFIQHTVEKKQTLYSISKLYNVQQNDILTANPELNDGLKEGQIIKIPVKKLKDETNKNSLNTPLINKDAIIHTVEKGETLYFLSKKYGVTVEDIKKENDGLTQGLREGEKILIPSNNKNLIGNSGNPKVTEAIDSVALVPKIEKKPLYTIGLLLPFYLDENDEIVEKRYALEERKIYPKSKFAIEFYNGFIKALDSLSSDSCKFKLFVYDTKGNDSARIKSLIQKPESKEFDLIVGPLFHNNFDIVAQFAKENKIPIVTPVPQSNKILLGNPYVFKAIPSKTSIIEPICKLTIDSFRNENLIVVQHEKSKEKGLVDLYLKEYSKLLQQYSVNDTSLYPPVKKVNVSNDFSVVINQCNKSKNNVLFVPTSDQTFITSFFTYLITNLNQKSYEDCKITIIGLEEWSNFKNIDMEYYQRLNVHYCSPQYVNENDSITSIFINNYINSNKTYPTETTILGFDLGYFFASGFVNYGTVFNTTQFNGHSITLNFFKTGIESGYENTNTNLLRFHDFEIQKLHSNPQ